MNRETKVWNATTDTHKKRLSLNTLTNSFFSNCFTVFLCYIRVKQTKKPNLRTAHTTTAQYQHIGFEGIGGRCKVSRHLAKG